MMSHDAILFLGAPISSFKQAKNQSSRDEHEKILRRAGFNVLTGSLHKLPHSTVGIFGFEVCRSVNNSRVSTSSLTIQRKIKKFNELLKGLGVKKKISPRLYSRGYDASFGDSGSWD